MSKLKVFFVNLIIAFGVAGLSALLTRGGSGFYESINLPPLYPPTWVFPVVWTILFFLMAISATQIYLSKSSFRKDALKVYGIQLVVNFLWTIIFFNLRALWFAFIWLILLWLLVLLMIYLFTKIKTSAGYLQIPYLLWITFAGYLTLAIALLN